MIHYFFDLDNTLCHSRAKISGEMKEAVSKLESVTVISGASEEQMLHQLDGLPCEVMSQNGNVNKLWERLLTNQERTKIIEHISEYTDIQDDELEDRGAQISYSFVGHHADQEKKKAYDPQGTKRKALLTNYPVPKSIEARIAGTTCLDYFPRGLNKGFNIRKFIKLKGWDTKSCIYVGDALFPGGNDESVIGVIPTYPVTSPEDTLRFLI